MSNPLVIYDANIPGLVSPIDFPTTPPLIGGVPLSLIVNQLLELWIDPWLNMDAGDYVGVLVNSSTNPAVGKTIAAGEENKRLTLSLNEAMLNNGPNQLRVAVTRIGNQTPQISAGLRVLFNKPRPGGEVTGSGTNANLKIALPPDVIANGVSPIRAAQGVDVTLAYLFMRALDVISLDLDGRIKTRTVTATEAAAGVVVIRLFAADLWQDNPLFAVKYRTVDQLGNTSGPLAIWSATTSINVYAHTPVLDLLPPKVLEAKDSKGTVINFARDFYSAPHATVQVAYTGSAPGHTVKVYWVGRNWTYGSEIQTVSKVGETLAFLVPRHMVVDCISGKARVYYTVATPSTPQEVPSKDLNLSVTEQQFHLGEPTLNSSKTNLRVYYPGLTVPFKVRISMTIGAQRYDSLEYPITQPSQTDIAVPPQWISSHLGELASFNFSLHETNTSNPLIFSWYLRVIL